MTEIPGSFHAAKYLNAVVPHQGVTEMATQWHACQVHSQIKILEKIHKAVINITAQTSPRSRYEIEFPSGLSLSFSADVAKEDSLVTSHKNL